MSSLKLCPFHTVLQMCFQLSFSQRLSLNQFNSYGERICHHSNPFIQLNNIACFSNTHCLETLVSLSRLRDLTISMTVSGPSDCTSKISAATSSDCSPALSLDRPVKASHLRVRVSARTATLMLDVVSSVVATVTSGVGVLTT